jgi:peptide/histidine transporter 3/4
MAASKAEAQATSSAVEERASIGGANIKRKNYSSVDAVPQSNPVVGAFPGVCICILVVELCERLAFYTFTGTQEPFLEGSGYTLAQSAAINSAMSTLCMTWSLLACWAADVGLGRYTTILCFGLLYALGSLIAAAAAWPSVRSIGVYLFSVMVLVPLGTAGIKANISNFGADQYDTSVPGQAEAQEKFFSWFYLSINLGSAVAYGYLTTLGSNGGLGIPKSHGYFAAYAIAASCMLLAVYLFRSGRPRYQMRQLQERWALFGVVRYVTEAARQGSYKAVIVCVGCLDLAASIVMSVMQAMWPQSPLASPLMGAAFVCAIVGILAVVLPCLDPNWLVGVRLEDGTFSNSDVRTFLSVIPTLITANLAFGALYNSMQYWYQQQACQMDLRVPIIGGQFAGSFFMIADCLGIVVATPLAINWANPFLERNLRGSFGFTVKYGLGMAFGIISVALAARFEMLRRSASVTSEVSNCAPAGIHMSDLSASWMIVPFFLMGLGEIYTQPVLMHFAYIRSPPAMQTLVVATSALIGAVSNGIFTLQINALSSFVPNDLNQGQLEVGYLSNIVIGVSFYAAFIYCARCTPEKTSAISA